MQVEKVDLDPVEGRPEDVGEEYEGNMIHYELTHENQVKMTIVKLTFYLIQIRLHFKYQMRLQQVYFKIIGITWNITS